MSGNLYQLSLKFLRFPPIFTISIELFTRGDLRQLTSAVRQRQTLVPWAIPFGDVPLIF
jgi:hypothetical protein